MRDLVCTAASPIPSWLPLGPAVDLDGAPAFPVLGDWSHLQECDQPPLYVRDSGSYNIISGYDRGETRESVRQTHPGRPIAELKGKHSGKVALLFNGASLAQHDLRRIKTPIIGMNRTHVGFTGYDGPQPDYLCLVDWCYFDHPKFKSALTHPAIINGSNHKAAVGHRVVRSPRFAPFSFDLARDGYAGPVPCTTGHLALQVAVYMGFTELYCIGWDLGGKHFNGTNASPHYNDAVRYHARQAELLEAAGIQVYVCGSPESRAPFPHAPFEAVC